MRRLWGLCFVVILGSCGDPGNEPLAFRAASFALYKLPWSCGELYGVTQGWSGDLCDHVGGDHTALQAHAWDFAMPLGTPIRAARDGKVSLVAMRSRPGDACFDGCAYGDPTCCSRCILKGNRVNVDHGDGTVAAYWHLSEIAVTPGAEVRQGDLLGYAGTSGCSTGPHLHFQVMGPCATDFCQSQPIDFLEMPRPACGARLVSRNCP